MKRFFVISAIVSVLLLACEKRQEPVAEQPLPFTFDENLLRIDSLLQHDADSALQTLLSFRADSVISTEAQRSGEISCHYHSLLLSEALYKTYNPQLNRFVGVETCHGASLQDAMQYFDSLYANYPKNDDLAMLSARSHYMNGVGYYENDSVVDACKEYLKTLEIMENHFDVSKLIGYKAKFMGLTYGRLEELFSDQFMTEPAIYCGKKALWFCQIEPSSKYGISRLNYSIGNNFDVYGQIDSAYYYYNRALELLPDSNTIVYRNLISSISLSLYKKNVTAEESINNLKQMIQQAESSDEKTFRYLTLGYIYYNEKNYDSAVVYLERVFNNNATNLLKFQSAEYLRDIYLSFENTETANIYLDFIANQTSSKYNDMMEVSILNDLFYNYLKRHQDKQVISYKKRIVLGIVLFITVVLIIVIVTKKKNKKIQSATTKYNKAKNKANKLEKELVLKRSETELRLESFLNEPVCRKINDMIRDIPTSARIHHSNYPKIKLDNETIIDLGEAVNKHFPNLKTRLISNDIDLKKDDLLLCYLYLLGLNNTQITLLRHCDYTTISRQANRLKKSFKGCKNLPKFVKKMAV